MLYEPPSEILHSLIFLTFFFCSTKKLVFRDIDTTFIKLAIKIFCLNRRNRTSPLLLRHYQYLPTATEGYGKVMFSVCLSVHRRGIQVSGPRSFLGYPSLWSQVLSGISMDSTHGAPSGSIGVTPEPEYWFLHLKLLSK